MAQASFKKRYRILWILIILAACSYFAWSEITRTRGAQNVSFNGADKSCGSLQRLRYCVYQDPSGTNGDIVYHLHGRNLDEQIWNDDTYFTAMLQAEWQRFRIKPPTVVTISYGPSWLLTPKGKKPASGLLEDFILQLPKIETKLGEPRRRLLLGESMGGLNVLVAGLSYPSHFDKVASLCPGVYINSPFSSLSTIRSAMERNGASPKKIFGIWLLSQEYFSSEEEWERTSPLELMEKAGPDFPALYLSNGIYDSFGNYEGTQLLARTAMNRGVQTEWHPLYGGHCSIDIPSLANFLTS